MDPSDITPRFHAGLNLAKSMRRGRPLNPAVVRAGTEFAKVHSRQAQLVKLVIFGTGVVGSSLIRRLISERPLLSQLHNADYRISCVLDSSGFLYSGNNFGVASHIGDGVLLNALSLKEVNHAPLRVYPDCGFYYSDFERIRHTLLDCTTIAVDCTNPSLLGRGSRDWSVTSVLSDHVSKGGVTITANKQNAVRCMEDCSSSVPRWRRFSLTPSLCAGGSVSSALCSMIQAEMDSCGGRSGVTGLRGLLSPFWNEILTVISDHLAGDDHDNTDSLRFSDLVLHCMKKRLTSSRDPRNDVFGSDLCDTSRIFSNLLCISPGNFHLESRDHGSHSNSNHMSNGHNPMSKERLSEMDLIDLESNEDIDRLMDDFAGGMEDVFPEQPTSMDYQSILSIFPESLLVYRQKGSLSEFMAELRKCDGQILANIKQLMDEHNHSQDIRVDWKSHCLRCLTSFDCESETVRPGQLVIVSRTPSDGDPSGMIGRCRGTHVCVEILSDTHDDCDRPLFIEGRAGGPDSVVSSLISEMGRLSAMLVNG